MKKNALIMTVMVSMTSCSDGSTPQTEKAGQAATYFAEAYFNYNFKQALELSTTESAKWISFAASNITQEDIDVLNTRQTEASVELTDCQMVNDSTCKAWLTVENYMATDSIGRPGVFKREGLFVLNVVARNGKWIVRMEGLPRSEKHNHD